MVGQQGLHGNLGQEEGVGEGNQRPQYCQKLPVVDAEEGEEDGADNDHGHVAPAVEGVEEAHGPLLVLRGAGLGHGTDNHLQQSATQGVGDDGDGDSPVGRHD